MKNITMEAAENMCSLLQVNVAYAVTEEASVAGDDTFYWVLESIF